LAPKSRQRRGRLVVISGPSGVGKSTIVREVLKRREMEFSVSVTTRKPRDNETDGKEYRFVTRQRFQEMLRAGELLEHAEVFGEFYGTPTEPVQRAIAAGRTILLEIDIQGALQVHEKMPDALFILIQPPEPDVLRDRLAKRGSDSPEQLAHRLAEAPKELALARESGIYTHRVVNDDLATAVRQVVDLIDRELEVDDRSVEERGNRQEGRR